MSMTCGEALVRLLESYGVDTVFGIPGVHTLELCRGLAGSSIRHVQARNEQGAGFMADGYARSSGRPGVCMVISGPGVTNALTAIGQAYADSMPVLMISSDAASHTLGKGWGALHEVPSLTTLTGQLTAFSACAMRPGDLPELVGKAFSIFASERPRPVHIAVPLDVLAQPVAQTWHIVTPPGRPYPEPQAVQAAATVLGNAQRPVIMVGGGACDASDAVRELAERLDAPVLTSNAGKGVISDFHPLAAGSTVVRPQAQAFLSMADAVLAVGRSWPRLTASSIGSTSVARSFESISILARLTTCIPQPLASSPMPMQACVRCLMHCRMAVRVKAARRAVLQSCTATSSRQSAR